jgi:hypothetical protein
MKNNELPTVPQRFIFEDKEIDFEITGSNVMVNATQMAKIFGKLPKDFLINENTKNFISECLKKENSPYLMIENEEDLVSSIQKSGTWMHRILALKFAAWLSPAFELWVYSVIDELLFGHYREMEDMLRRTAETRNRIDALREALREDDRFSELESLEVLDKQYQRVRSRKTTSQLELFRSFGK